jgi:hypothetical protein
VTGPRPDPRRSTGPIPAPATEDAWTAPLTENGTLGGDGRLCCLGQINGSRYCSGRRGCSLNVSGSSGGLQPRRASLCNCETKCVECGAWQHSCSARAPPCVTKTGKSRKSWPVKSWPVDLGAETVTLLRAHKRAQAELEMKNRGVYRDHGLVFTKEQADLFGEPAAVGTPLQMKNIEVRDFSKLRAAGNAPASRSTAYGTPARRCCHWREPR